MMKPDPRNELRQPRQQRSRYKVELILEATIRLLEQGGPEALTTNAVAASAGVSIGTLYQFFPNKEAILDTLAERELTAMSAKVMAVMQDPAIDTPEERVAAIVEAVAASYGHRETAHRHVMTHSLGRHHHNPVPAMMQAIMAHLSSGEGEQRAMSPVDAFVVIHAFGGVLRAMTREGDKPPRQEIAQALTRLIMGFLP